MADELVIGVATADITPPVGAVLVGYKPRVSEGVAHRLRAEAIVVRGGGGAWAMVTSDTLGYRRDFVAEVRLGIAEATDLASEAVMVTGTHTHSGPATGRRGDGELPDCHVAYLAELKQRLVGVVADAAAAAAPGALVAGRTEAPGLASNRRVQGDDGEWVNEWQDPDGEHPGYVDATVQLAGVRRPGGSLDALLVNFGCHPVTLGPDSLVISADYPGYLKDALEADGVAGTAMFALGCAGNVNPRVCIQAGAEHPESMGRRLAEVVAAAAADLQPVSPGAVVAVRRPWAITRTRDAFKHADRPDAKAGAVIETEVHALRAGGLVVVGLPGEVFSEYQRIIRDGSPAEHTVIASVANDSVGYFPTDEGLAQGAYEAKMCPADPIQDALSDHARRALDAAFA